MAWGTVRRWRLGSTDEADHRRYGRTDRCRPKLSWPAAAEATGQDGINLEVVKHPMAKNGFVLLPLRGVVECSFDSDDYEPLDTPSKDSITSPSHASCSSACLPANSTS
jgi:hypothetical protein